MMERVLDIRVTRYGTIIEEIELICCMTGFRRRLLVEHIEPDESRKPSPSTRQP